MYKHILIATDGSEPSQKGLAQGLELASRAGAKVTIITVTEPFPSYDLASKLGLFQDQELVAKYNSESRDLAARILSDAEAAGTAAGVSCETLHVENSGPATAILQAAKFRSCDLVVVTSHGRRGLERVVLGSQATEILQGATTPVLVVR